jgi:integrase
VTDVLTLDNLHLSAPTNRSAREYVGIGENQQGRSVFAINCTSGISHLIGSYVQAGTSLATRRAYRLDLEHYLAWGGILPSVDEQIAAYLVAHAGTLKIATLARRLAAISAWHEALGARNPVGSALIRATLRGIRRKHGVAQLQAKPLLRADLFALLETMGGALKDDRDRAILLIGFAGGFRRSELTALDLGDLGRDPRGLIITIRRSKTDQDGHGRKIGIPVGRSRWCPVHSFDRWREASNIQAGPLFRPINRHGQLSSTRLSGAAVCSVIKERLQAAGYDPRGFSGHSLRAGFVTCAAQVGVPSFKIRQQTGHASDAMLSRYIRDGELFLGNAAGALL